MPCDDDFEKKHIASIVSNGPETVLEWEGELSNSKISFIIDALWNEKCKIENEPERAYGITFELDKTADI